MTPTNYELFLELKSAAELGYLKPMKEALKIFTETWITLPLVLAIASRETNMRHIIGDRGNGYGLMQIDVRTDIAVKEYWNKDLISYIIKAINILNDKRHIVLRFLGKELTLTGRDGITKYTFKLQTNISTFDINRITIASYNCGYWALYGYAVRKNPDYLTTGKNYSKDVILRANVFSLLLHSVENIANQLV